MRRSPAVPSNDERRVDFDIHGVVGIRVVDGSSSDIAAVTRQLGPLQRPLLRAPDITLRFVIYQPTCHLRHAGLTKNRFSDDAFFVLDEKTNAAKVRIPFDRLGGRCEILCESGLRSVPLLMPILSLTALAKGYVAVHASAFVHNGVGVLMAGCAESGKTTTLLGFASRGAEFIGEEWVLLSGDGEQMCGLPRDIELSASHLSALHVRGAINRRRLWLLDGLRGLNTVHKLAMGATASYRFLPNTLARVLAALEQRATPKVSPQAIFGDRIGSLVAKPEKLFLLVSHDAPWVRVQRIPPSRMARRIAYLTEHEHSGLMDRYLAFKFAFPEKSNMFIERMQEYQADILSRALVGKDTHIVYHPYPSDFSELYKTLQPFLEQTAQKELTLANPSC